VSTRRICINQPKIDSFSLLDFYPNISIQIAKNTVGGVESSKIFCNMNYDLKIRRQKIEKAAPAESIPTSITDGPLEGTKD